MTAQQVVKLRTRRLFLLSLPGIVVIPWVLFTGPILRAADDPRWFRGQMHAHTYWSDGRGFPEQALDAYKRRGYQFVSLTDHNRFAEDLHAWRKVSEKEGKPLVWRPIFDTYVRTFGKPWVETRTEGPDTFVRLKTYAEVKARFDEPGKFLTLPGVEVTQTLHGLGVHLNCINLPLLLPGIQGANLNKTVTAQTTVGALIALNAAEARQAAIRLHQPYLLILNHPFWVHYDVQPQDLIDCPQVQFFEVCNGGSQYPPHPQLSGYGIEKFWDIVNAFRRVQGRPLLYGIGSDDAHFYDARRIKGKDGVGDAWVMVRATALTADALIAAMQRGDFYASCGMFLDEVAFTPADRTLRVKVKAEPGVHYRIHFITTKRGFDRAEKGAVIPAELGRPARVMPLFSDAIGRTVKSVAGTEAAYQMAADDLYVRARVDCDRPAQITPYFHPKTQTAWTQPYTAPEPSADRIIVPIAK